MRFTFWYISLPSSAKQQCELTKFKVLWRGDFLCGFVETVNFSFFLLARTSGTPESASNVHTPSQRRVVLHRDYPQWMILGSCRCRVAYQWIEIGVASLRLSRFWSKIARFISKYLSPSKMNCFYIANTRKSLRWILILRMSHKIKFSPSFIKDTTPGRTWKRLDVFGKKVISFPLNLRPSPLAAIDEKNVLWIFKV